MSAEDISKLLAFDVWGDYAHFRRPYSTTSPLTFPFPTRTAISGLIAAIIGRKRDSYYDEFSPGRIHIGLQILSAIRKILIGVNLIDTKKGLYLWDISANPRTQILYETLRDVRYRIYVWVKSDETYTKLKQRLEEHTSFYTPYLGIAQMLANFNFVKEYTSIKRRKASYETPSPIVTVVPEQYGVLPNINHRIGRANMPLYMDNNRQAKYQTLVYDACYNYSPDNHALVITDGQYYELDDYNNIVIL